MFQQAVNGNSLMIACWAALQHELQRAGSDRCGPAPSASARGLMPLGVEQLDTGREITYFLRSLNWLDPSSRRSSDMVEDSVHSVVLCGSLEQVQQPPSSRNGALVHRSD